MTRTRGRYLGRSAETVEVAGRPYDVRVHWAEVDGRAVCVGLDLRAFTSKAEARLRLEDDARPVGGSWSEVNSETVRGVRVAQQVEESRVDLAALLVSAVGEPPRLRAAIAKGPERRKRGPVSQWSEDVLLHVVRPAYLAGGRKRAEAVREALEQHRGEHVTYEQAKHGIRAARKAGLLPPANKGAQQ